MAETARTVTGQGVAAGPALRRLSLGLFGVAFGTNVSTPLLLAYQQEMGLFTWAVTALFAIYPVGLTPAIVWGGPASDVLGRKALMVPAVVMSGVSSLLFILGASNLAALFMARLLLGGASGLGIVAASAWMQELGATDQRLAVARLTGMVVYGGFAAGPLVGGILGQWGPAPLVVPYLVHLALVGAGLVVLREVPETWPGIPGGRIRPRLGLPAGTRRAFLWVVVPTALAVFGFLSVAVGLFPVLLRPAMARIALFVTGATAALASLSIFLAQGLIVRVGALRSAPLALGAGTAGAALGAVAFATSGWPLLFPASIFLGVASGLALTAGLRFVDILTDPHNRGAMVGLFYTVAYSAMVMPVVVASIAAVSSYQTVLWGYAALAALGTVWLRWAIRSASLSAPAGSG